MHQATKWIIGAGVALALQAGAVLAQGNQPSSPPAVTTPRAAAGVAAAPGPVPAPVGHRQPKQSDLSPDAQKKEAPADSGFSDLDTKLRICKGC